MPPQNLRAVGDRIEQLLDELHASADDRAVEIAEDLLRAITELYGAGLERVVQLVAGVSPDLHEQLFADELVGSLLLVHGLHPERLEVRVERALASVRPFLAQHGGDVELIDVDARAGAVYIRLLGSCDGCPSSKVTLQGAVEVAIVEAAPEIVTIDVEEPEPAPIAVPVSLGRRADLAPERGRVAYEQCPTEVASA